MKLFWLDLETTGLDPDKDLILEVALAEADFKNPFEIKHLYQSVLIFEEHSGRILDPFVKEMHTKNGLLEECRTSYLVDSDVEERLLEWIPEIQEKEEKPVLAGSSIHFDLRFLQAHMPRVARRFSYRLYDVSAVKLFCQSLGMEKLPKAEAHRAKDDIEESVKHGKMCKEWLKKNINFNHSDFLESIL